MNKQSSFFLVLMTASFLFADGQQQFIQIANKANSYCNSTCTLLDVPELNKNPRAVVFATPIQDNGISMEVHPIGVRYINEKWSILNLDQKTMPAGSKFNVQYFSKPDPAYQFLHTVNMENLSNNNTRSYIDHSGLNNNADAKFQFIVNGINGGFNTADINIQYDNVVAKWYLYNTNKRPLEYNSALNIIIGSTKEKTAVVQIPGAVRNDITALDTTKAITSNKKTITQPAQLPTVLTKSDIPAIKNPKTIAPAYDFSNVRICIDKLDPKSLPLKPPPVRIPKIKPNGEIDPISSISQGLTGVTDKMWTPGDTITVGFNTGQTTSFVIGKVKAFAIMWESFANIKFKFIADVTKSQVKVGFVNDNTSWSNIGRDVLDNPGGFQTVNFGWFNDNTPDTEFRRVIVHEFGHVLGFIHEHQAPAAGIPWDTAKVYTFFGGPPNNWSHDKTKYNIIDTYASTGTNSSSYDKFSIMHYFFPSELVTDGSVFTWNTNLSATDKQFARQVYPYPPTQTGVLQTGDDCDEIEFSVEYDVVPKNVMEFTLEPGRDANNNLITWWKKIAIPVVGNGEVGLEIQDGHSVTKSIAAAILDKSRGISFGKAKALGVHTGLNFQWKAMPAILGGCRVKLKWRRDKC